MDTLKVCVSWVITSFTKCFKTSLHQCANTTAENCLLTEEVCFCFCSECCLKNTCSCSADTKCICKSDILCVACCVLLNCDKARCTLTSLILRTYCVTRSLRCDHDNIDILWWYDAAKVNVKAVCECKSLTLCEVWLDRFLIKCSLLLIRNKDHDDVRCLCSFLSCHNCKTLLLSLCPALRTFVKTYYYVNTALLKVECMSVTL